MQYPSHIALGFSFVIDQAGRLARDISFYTLLPDAFVQHVRSYANGHVLTNMNGRFY